MKAALAAKLAEAKATKASNEFDDLQDLLVAIHALLPGTDGETDKGEAPAHF